MNKTVLITGTSSGLGRATAEYFHAKGWNVVATMRTPAREHALDRLDRMLVTRLDVEDEDSIDAAVAEAIARFGHIDVLVNNAGYGAYGPLEATPIDKMRRQFEVNVLGLLATTRALLPHFRSRRRGAIVNVSSMGGRIAFPLGSLYHGSKFAVEGISESLQYELAPIGVAVKVVEPGFMNTDFGGRSLDVSQDERLAEYQPLVRSLMATLGEMSAQAGGPELAAEVIYGAAVDDSDRLRYVAGSDAERLLAQRGAVDDASFFAGVKAQFGLA